MTERFNLNQFQDALPVNKNTGQKLWKSLGLDKGEYSFEIPVNSVCSILIRSSIDHSGFCADSGKDSIRTWLVNPANQSPVGSKLSLYTTRVSGWEERMTNQLRKLFRLAKQVKTCQCGEVVKIFKIKKEGPNKGKFFTCCADSACRINPFQFLDDDLQPKK